MVLDSHRGKVDFIMDPAARALRNVHPNYISFMDIILAAVAGLMLYFSYDHWVLLPLSAVVVLVSGFLDGLDWFCSNILLTVCGILICIFAGWVVCDKVKSEVTNDGQVSFSLLAPWLWILRVVAPAAIIIIIYSGLK